MNFNEFEKWAEQEVKRYNESSLKNNDIEFSVNRIQIIGNTHENPELLEDNNDF